jgi:CMP-N,N'-diacetyllegionaminic acid synthase
VNTNIALIPARGGSKRILNKNSKLLNGHPLIAHTINSAKETQLFDRILVSTDNFEIAEIARRYGAEVPTLRPAEYATDLSPDIDWITHCVLKWNINEKSTLVLLRPTSPLRKAATIRFAVEYFEREKWADSLRAMQLVSEHPGKMWKVNSINEAIPYLEQHDRKVPTHSSPTNTLEEVWIQNASLEIVKVKTILNKRSLAGDRILKFEMPGLEGFDLNSMSDWDYLEFLIQSDRTLISKIERE